MGRNSRSKTTRARRGSCHTRSQPGPDVVPQKRSATPPVDHCLENKKSLLSLSSADSRSETPSAGTTPTKTPTKTPTSFVVPSRAFSPRKLSTVFKAVEGSGILNGGANYSKAASSTAHTGTHQNTHPEDISDEDLMMLSQDLDMDPDFMDQPKSSKNREITASTVPSHLSDPFEAVAGLTTFTQDLDQDPDFMNQPSCSKACSTPFKYDMNLSANAFDADPDMITLSQDLDMDPDFSGQSSLGGECSQPTGEQYSVDYFSLLPLEVIENIFCRLPILDLCLHMTRVCTQWNEIISEPKFLHWKKAYFRILRGSEDHKKKILAEMSSHGMNVRNVPSLLPGLVRHMQSYKPVTSPNMTECLKRHSKYHWATALIRERLPECITEEEANPWCVIAALVILSADTDDILSILTCLLNPPSQCTGKEVIECLYSVATYLLVFRSIKYEESWTGMHYRMFYALYLYENSAVVISDTRPPRPGTPDTCLPAPPTSKLKYTQEQMRICNHDVSHGDVIKIVAFAGTGKTTTLIRYSQLRPHSNFLMIVFNKSVQEDCCKRFPSNVECLTSHALARRSAVGSQFRDYQIGSIRIRDILDHAPRHPGLNMYQQAKFIQETLNKFMCSADPVIDHRHVPFTVMNKWGKAEYIGESNRESVVQDARRIWQKATDPLDNSLKLPHDGYLKLYQLSKPRIHLYHIILIDEAQDQTPAVIDILMNQSQPKILVGDPNQQIYSFRGAVNAMTMFTATTTFFLTQSFRFGSNIAYVANCCLEVLKGKGPKILVGNTSKGFVDGRQVGQLAIITRTNFTLFKEAVSKCSQSSDPHIKVAITGGTGAFGFDMIQDIYWLMKQKTFKIKNKLVKKFKTFRELEGYATSTGDLELSGKIKIVSHYGDNVMSHVKQILEHSVSTLEDADVVLSTAHKSKGLEFSTVRLTNDFTENISPADACTQQGSQTFRGAYHRPPREESPDEFNLLYVAVTRAKKSLQLTPSLMRVLHFAGEKFRVPQISTSLTAPLTCILSDLDFSPQAITLTRREIKLGDRQKLTSGVYSPQVIDEDMRALSGLYGNQSPRQHTRPAPRVQDEPDWAPEEEDHSDLGYMLQNFF